MKHRQFVYLVSFVIGILSGLAAVLLKNTVHFVNHFLTHILEVNNANFMYFVYPIIGIVLTVLFVK